MISVSIGARSQALPCQFRVSLPICPATATAALHRRCETLRRLVDLRFTAKACPADKQLLTTIPFSITTPLQAVSLFLFIWVTSCAQHRAKHASCNLQQIIGSPSSIPCSGHGTRVLLLSLLMQCYHVYSILCRRGKSAGYQKARYGVRKSYCIRKQHRYKVL
jgi:hypothetical protein